MARHAASRDDFVPHLPDLIVSMAGCWRAIRDAQTEVDPFGRRYGALGEARASLDTLAYVLTGQSEFFALGTAAAPRTTASVPAHDGAPF